MHTFFQQSPNCKREKVKNVKLEPRKDSQRKGE